MSKPYQFTPEQVNQLEDLGLTRYNSGIRTNHAYELVSQDGLRLVGAFVIEGKYQIRDFYNNGELLIFETFEEMLPELEVILTDVLGQYNSSSEEDKVFRNYELALKRADWTYMYSDDHRAYTRGMDSVNNAAAWKQKALKLNPERAEELWDKYSVRV